MPALYPTSIKTFTTKTDKVDLNSAAHVNDLQNEVTALETAIGTQPRGSMADLTERLYVSLDNDGAVRHGTAFPASPKDGQPFYRTDEDTFYIYNGSAWLSSVSKSNLVFAWSGVESALTGSWGLYGGRTIKPQMETTSVNMSFFACCSSVYQTMLRFTYKHISGVTAISLNARLWCYGAYNTVLQVNIGAVSASVTGSQPTPVWVTTSSIDVSGLTAGSMYECNAVLRSSLDGAAYTGYCSAVTLIAN